MFWCGLITQWLLSLPATKVGLARGEAENFRVFFVKLINLSSVSESNTHDPWRWSSETMQYIFTSFWTINSLFPTRITYTWSVYFLQKKKKIGALPLRELDFYRFTWYFWWNCWKTTKQKTLFSLKKQRPRRDI